RAILSDDFNNASGQYFDNDSVKFASPHPDVLDPKKCDSIIKTMNTILNEKNGLGEPERKNYLSQIQSILDSEHKWEVIYAGIEALGEVIMRSNASLTEKAFLGDKNQQSGGSQQIGLQTFLNRDKWKIRAKATEELIKIASQKEGTFQEKSIVKTWSKILLSKMYVVEKKNSKVMKFLRDSQEIYDLEWGLNKSWQRKSRFPSEYSTEQESDRKWQRKHQSSHAVQDEKKLYKKSLLKRKTQHLQNVSSHIQSVSSHMYGDSTRFKDFTLEENRGVLSRLVKLLPGKSKSSILPKLTSSK
ncbi:MAG: hypothetical protein AAF320_04960, partial [Myxococcota bacterium]